MSVHPRGEAEPGVPDPRGNGPTAAIATAAAAIAGAATADGHPSDAKQHANGNEPTAVPLDDEPPRPDERRPEPVLANDDGPVPAAEWNARYESPAAAADDGDHDDEHEPRYDGQPASR